MQTVAYSAKSHKGKDYVCPHSTLRGPQVISWVLQLPLLLEKELEEQSHLYAQGMNQLKAGGGNVM